MARRRRSHIEQISAEHATISASLGAFESTLASPFTCSEATWRRRVRRELGPLIDCLGQHCVLAEGAGGVFGEIEVAIGHGHELTTARRLHRSALRQADELDAALGTADAGPSVDEVRKRGRRLGSAIRRHHTLEADLVLHVFNQETGTGD